MRKTHQILSTVAVVSGMLAIAVLTWPSRATAQIPEKFENLQVAPKHISRMDLLNSMKDMTFALGTRCWFCHEGEGDDLSTFDFASDKKAAKDVTRTMMKMVEEINSRFISKVEEDAKVTCYTCHRGHIEPEE